MRAALLLAGVLLLSACGGGGDDNRPLGKAEYVKKANAVCEKAAKARSKLDPAKSAADFARFSDEFVGTSEKLQAELAKLQPPAADKLDLENKVLAPYSSFVQEARGHVQKVSALGGDEVKLKDLQDDGVPGTGGVDVKYLRSYGLSVCAELVAADDPGAER